MLKYLTEIYGEFVNKYDNLMIKIGTEFNIKKGKTENINDYKVRLIYSVLGRMAVASF